MDTLKISQSQKEFNLLLTPRTHHSKNLEMSTKVLSYPSCKLNKQNSSILSRKLLEEIKALQKENKELKNMVSSLKQDKQYLLERCRQYESCQSLIDCSESLLESLKEIKPQIDLSQSIVYEYEPNEQHFQFSSKKSDYILPQAFQSPKLRINSQPNMIYNLLPTHQNLSSIQQQFKTIISSYSNKINELLKINQNLTNLSKDYRQKYLKLKQDILNRSKTSKHIYY